MNVPKLIHYSTKYLSSIIGRSLFSLKLIISNFSLIIQNSNLRLFQVRWIELTFHSKFSDWKSNFIKAHKNSVDWNSRARAKYLLYFPLALLNSLRNKGYTTNMQNESTQHESAEKSFLFSNHRKIRVSCLEYNFVCRTWNVCEYWAIETLLSSSYSSLACVRCRTWLENQPMSSSWINWTWPQTNVALINCLRPHHPCPVSIN